MSKKDVKYTRITLKELVMEARRMGIEVSFTNDMDGKYIIRHTVISSAPNCPSVARDEIYHPETVAMAHWLIKGMMAQARSQLAGYCNADM